MWKNEGNELANSGEHNLFGIAAHVSELPAETRLLRSAHQSRTCAAKDFIPHKHPDDVCEFPCSHTGMVGSTEYFSRVASCHQTFSPQCTLETTTNHVEPPGAPLYTAELFNSLADQQQERKVVQRTTGFLLSKDHFGARNISAVPAWLLYLI